MPTLLVIADLGHASPRFPGICQKLSQLGWEIDLVTPRMSTRQKNDFLFNEDRQWNLVETPWFLMRYKRIANSTILLRALFKFGYKLVDGTRQLHRRLILKSPEEYGFSDHAGWERHVNRAVRHLLKTKKYDLVLSSSSPFTAHIIARNIAQQLNIPWVADYRDLYSLNHTNPLSDDAIIFESSLIESARALLTVSEGFAKSQKQVYPGEIIVVNNGYRELSPCKKVKIDGPIKILYTGTIENGFQNLELFLKSLEELNSERTQTEVTFVGSSCTDVRKFYSGRSKTVPSFIHLNGNVSRETSLSLQKSADLLLYFECSNLEIKGVLLTKLYEYVASGSSILRVGATTNDEASRILHRIGYTETLSSQEKIVERISEFSRLKLISTVRNDEVAAYYSYTSIASRVDHDLRRIIRDTPAEEKIGA
ncbi:GT4_WbuB-like domain containing protein [Candidatus Nanopelagicaceae bacterium]